LVNQKTTDLIEIIELLEKSKMEYDSVIIERLIDSLSKELQKSIDTTEIIEKLIMRNINARHIIGKKLIELRKIHDELLDLLDYEEEL